MSYEIAQFFVLSTVTFNSHPWLNRGQIYSSANGSNLGEIVNILYGRDKFEK